MLAAEAAGPAPPSASISLYIHVPFCVSKCAYCDFYSLAEGARDAEAHGHYLEAVGRAIEATAPLLGDVETVYVGGGTSTVLGERLVEILARVRAVARVRADAEITVETNPETTDADLIAALVAEGVNRFSLGVQSFDDAVLRTLGRCHDSESAARACAVLAAAGVPFSIDLMCGVPGQTMTSWDDTLERAAHTGAAHASVYALSLEEGTPLERAVDRGEVAAPDPDVAAAMMALAREALGCRGLERYEVANYARPGSESRHNTGYWTGRPYVGIGPGAHSMLPVSLARSLSPASVWGPLLAHAPEGARVRFMVNDSVADFVRRGWERFPAEHEVLTSAEAAREDVMLGMRLAAGVSEGQAADAAVTGVLERLAADGLVERSAGRWRATERGWLLGNEVFGAIWNET